MKKMGMRVLAVLLLSCAGLGAAVAADYPMRPLKIVVPFGPGGATDLVARVLAENLQARLGQPAVVENRPGASTAIGAAAVAGAPADGYTLLAVPYRGSAPAMLALMGGEIDMAVDTLSSALPHIQAGKLRALAVFGKTRVPQLPNVATVAEQGLPGATFSGWYAVALPAGTPQPVRDRLAAAIQTTMATEPVRTTFDKSALQAVFVAEPAFRARVEQEIKTFREVGQRAHIVME
ncbi:MAG: hypothetical protein GAK30_02530 [Paracidovorax wautersii]|uniref:Tripartite-type tricarboxylate transporter, receptor component TctC n=1 Tax=Paracidovorax wautersii TaxID=1177982 RepID=A0A7V8FMT2_9BURK|nr:MAG: hypothetical protein GAK30_02530 [Paracidovorax wautersii]